MGGCSSCTLHPLLQDATAAKALAAEREAVRSDPPDVVTCSTDTQSSVSTLTESSPAGSVSSSHGLKVGAAMSRASSNQTTSGVSWLPVPPSRQNSTALPAADVFSTTSGTLKATSEQLARDISHVALEATLQQIVALPFAEFLKGPAPVWAAADLPPGADRNFGLLGEASSPQVEALLTAAVLDAGVDTAILTVNSTRRVWVRNNEGFRPGSFPWCWSAWQARAPAPQLLVVSDTLAITELREQLATHPPPHVRFFAGVPLVGEGGLVLGSLSLIGREPKTPSVAQCEAFTTYAASVSEEVGKDLAARQRLMEQPMNTVSSNDLAPLVSAALRQLNTQAVLYIEAARQQWQAEYANDQFSEVSGIARETATSTPLWSLFRRPFDDASEAWEASQEVAARGDEFVIRAVQIADAPDRGTFSLHFRPADQGGLDDDAELQGLPAQMPSAQGAAGHPYFVLVAPEAPPPWDGGEHYTPAQMAQQARGSAVSCSLIEGLELGPLLGRGSFGNVFRGRYKGKRVAVKVCTGSLRASRGKTQKPWRNTEATQVRKLRHPNIVAALKHTTVLVQDGDIRASSWSNSSRRRRRGSIESRTGRIYGGSASDGRGSAVSSFGSCGSDPDSTSADTADWSDDSADELPEAPAVEMETWLVMEYCNKGTLKSGIDRGYFEQPALPGATADDGAARLANVPVVLTIAAEIASAMAYLHSRCIVHGDLCGTNILLTSDKTAQPHGFRCKIADFGMSRELKLQCMQTVSYGTVTHMPPELMLQQQLSVASDVYSFGVLLWELATSRHAWEGMSHTQVIAAVTMERQTLQFPDNAHPGIAALSRLCTHWEPLQRPTFIAIQDQLAALFEAEDVGQS